jgi:hypothetical protein
MRATAVRLAVVLCLLGAGCGSGEDAQDELGKELAQITQEKKEIAQRENELRSTKPSFEDAQEQYGSAARYMADRITDLVPGLRWYYHDDSWGGCTDVHSKTRARQVYQLIAFSGPIPDDKWAQALRIVEDTAASFGATHYGVFRDQPGFHDIYLSGPDGVDFRLGTHGASSLSVKSDCRMREEDTPTPTPTSP